MKVNLIADQIIRLCGDEVNVHDIESVILDDRGIITSYIRSTNRVEAKAEAGVSYLDRSEDEGGVRERVVWRKALSFRMEQWRFDG